MRLYSILVWPIEFLCFLVLLIPWGRESGYYLTPAGVFLIGSCLNGYVMFESVTKKFRPIQPVIIFGLIGLLSVFAVKKFLNEARQHHGTKEVIHFLMSQKETTEKPLVLRMPHPCLEASDHLSFFLGSLHWVRELSAEDDSFLTVPDSNVRKLLILNKECSMIPKKFHVSKTICSYPPWYVVEGEA